MIREYVDLQNEVRDYMRHKKPLGDLSARILCFSQKCSPWFAIGIMTLMSDILEEKKRRKNRVCYVFG